MGKRATVLLIVSSILLVVSGISFYFFDNRFNEKKIENLQMSLIKEKDIKDYVQYIFVSQKEDQTLKQDGIKLYSYDIDGTVNKKFMNLSDNEKLNVLLRIFDKTSKETNSHSLIECGKKQYCSIDEIKLSEDAKEGHFGDEFKMDFNETNNEHEMEITHYKGTLPQVHTVSGSVDESSLSLEEQSDVTLTAKEVQYNRVGNLGKYFFLKGNATLEDYYNYGFTNEKDFFSVKIIPDYGDISDEWYIYFKRDEHAELYNELLNSSNIPIEVIAGVPEKTYRQEQGNMAIGMQTQF
ncbi:hypothetical protein GFV16_00060 [Bacillus megaterium]|uniref:hypothetical protein n=1 Tax=Priestia megaterium TaxID=1404 RepID=UPI001293AC4D|nr:hypothetical protein [Priestia megaterium]MQR84337.1 hypothetical protein [Priestia megaterium]